MCLCFLGTYNIIFPDSKSKISSILLASEVVQAALCLSYLVRNPDDKFSREAAFLYRNLGHFFSDLREVTLAYHG